MSSTQPDRSTSERGAVIIEFAMVAPILIMLIMGVVQVGLLLSQQQALHAAAREGARTASFPGSTATEIRTAVSDAYDSSFGPNPQILISPATRQPCFDRQGESVTVDLALRATLDIPFLAGQTVGLTSSGTFRCE